MSFSTEQLNHLKGKLEAQKSKLEDVLQSLKNGDPSSTVTRTTDNADVGTEATESKEMVEYEALENETQILLDRTNAALERMSAGTYGVTDDGLEIPFERLDVDPTVTTVIR